MEIPISDEISSPLVGAKQPEGWVQSSNNNSWVDSWKHVQGEKEQQTSFKRISRLYSVVIRSLIHSVKIHVRHIWATIKCWFQTLNIVADYFGQLMAHTFTLLHPLTPCRLISVVPCSLTVSRAMWSSVSEFRSGLSRHREHSVPDIWRRGAGKLWHWGVMKKCLCVRGLKNSPFKVVCQLVEQRQEPVPEICCKDYRACILYQGAANRISFMCPALAVSHLPFLWIPLLVARSSSGPSFHFPIFPFPFAQAIQLAS